MKHCLIVDDSNSIRKVASRVFKDLSLRATEADTHERAFETCRQEMPDCIIVDWMMPDGDGVNLVSELRKLPGGEQPVILYLTSENDKMQIARALRCGANGHMMKPFDSESIARTMSAVGII